MFANSTIEVELLSRSERFYFEQESPRWWTFAKAGGTSNPPTIYEMTQCDLPLG
jgi:hypothetical protein